MALSCEYRNSSSFLYNPEGSRGNLDWISRRRLDKVARRGEGDEWKIKHGKVRCVYLLCLYGTIGLLNFQWTCVFPWSDCWAVLLEELSTCSRCSSCVMVWHAVTIGVKPCNWEWFVRWDVRVYTVYIAPVGIELYVYRMNADAPQKIKNLWSNLKIFYCLQYCQISGRCQIEKSLVKSSNSKILQQIVECIATIW